jgi:molybdenum cofactor guanylyltransferase
MSSEAEHTILPVSAIILAGGLSRRMGQPKALLKFGKDTILERTIHEMRAFNDVTVIAAPAATEPFPIAALLAPISGVRLLRDAALFQGAATALEIGLRAARHDIVFACSCDLPLLTSSLAQALCGMLDDFDAVIPIIGGSPQPLCAVYRRGVAGIFAERLAAGERRLTSIVAGLNACCPSETEMRRIDPDLKSFLNVNTPGDYARVLAMLTGE